MKTNQEVLYAKAGKVSVGREGQETSEGERGQRVRMNECGKRESQGEANGG